MKKKLYISLFIILCVGLIILLFYSYYNVIVFVENSSPTDDCIDIQIMCDDKTLVNDTFYYAQFSPNYKMSFAHISKGEHLIKAKSNIASIEKVQKFYFTRKRTYLIVNYHFFQVDQYRINNDTVQMKKTFVEKQLDIGITTKKFRLQ